MRAIGAILVFFGVLGIIFSERFNSLTGSACAILSGVMLFCGGELREKLIDISDRVNRRPPIDDDELPQFSLPPSDPNFRQQQLVKEAHLANERRESEQRRRNDP